MAEKEILTRIQHKYDTQTNWEKATGFTPKKGELIIYSDIKKFKVGDGSSKLSALQFYDTNTTYDLTASASASNGNVKLNLTAGGSGSGTDSVTIKGSGATTVTTDASGNITISSTDNNTTYTFDGAVSTIKDSNLTASRALISNSSGKVAVSDITSTELGYLDGITSNIQTQLDKKAGDFSIEIYNSTGGNPKPVRFASFNYSTCNSENGIAAKISLVSGHGNGASYAFLEDAIIRVNYNGNVEVDNFKYYGTATDTYDGANRQYGDIFWLVDTTNKIVDFYCLMGQYARLYQTPWKRLTSSSGGTVTQHTSCTVYSSGTKVWGNNSDIALMSDLDAIPTPDVSGQIDAHNSSTSAHGDIRNSVSSLDTRLTALESSVVTIHSGAEEPISTLGEDGDLYLVTE